VRTWAKKVLEAKKYAKKDTSNHGIPSLPTASGWEGYLQISSQETC
jgi:hypothetical protein